MRVVRVLLYDGPKEWLEQTLDSSISGVYIPGTKADRTITELLRVNVDETATFPKDWLPGLPWEQDGT